MKITSRIKPTSGFSHFLHIGLTVLLPALLFVLVRVGFFQLGLALIILSKWRMFAVKPRHWPANIRANAVDIMVGVALLVFMASSGNQTNFEEQTLQLLWAVVYGVWLMFIKPRSGTLMVSLQAAIGQLLALVALFLAGGNAPTYLLVIASWFICYTAARHFFTGFDEPLASFLSHAWGYFAGSLVWVLSHWLVFYGVIAQPTLLLAVLGFGLSTLYFLEKTDRLSVLLKRQFIFVMVAIVVIVIVFSDWGDKAI